MFSLLNLSDLQKENLTIKSFYLMNYENFNMPMHKHDYIEIMYVSKGKCTVTLAAENGTREAALTPQQFIIINTDIFHSLHVQTSATIMNIELKLTAAPMPSCLSFAEMKAGSPSLAQFAQEFKEFAVFEDIANVNRIMRQIYAEDLKSDKQDTLLVTQSLINILFVYIARCKDIPLFSSGNAHYNKALRYINKHICDPITIQEIADHINISKAHLSRLFRDHAGETVFQYINRTKVERAKKMILNTDLPLIDIAITMGYQSRQSFFLSFKKETGISPQEYRQTVQKRSFTVYHGIYQHHFDTPSGGGLK